MIQINEVGRERTLPVIITHVCARVSTVQLMTESYSSNIPVLPSFSTLEKRKSKEKRILEGAGLLNTQGSLSNYGDNQDTAVNLAARNFCWERGFAWTLFGSHGLFVWFSNPVEESG